MYKIFFKFFLTCIWVGLVTTNALSATEKGIKDAVYLINNEKYVEAALILRELSSKDPMAAFFLGELHATGRGVAQDNNEAERWFALADKQTGLRGKASYDMAWEFMHGAVGLPPDYDRAAIWIQNSAKLNHPQAKPLASLLRHRAEKCSTEAKPLMK